MARQVRYRSGVDGVTGKLLTGKAHLAQSLAVLWTTRPGQRFMLLDFGDDLRAFLAEDITPDLALDIYDDLVTATHSFEPEYRIANLQLVSLTRIGGLGLRHDGTYYPEGRLGNYAIAEPFGDLAPLAAREALARRFAA
ncbi:prophage LambdaW5, baseplate assembly protein W, putative [Fulvimarina pelagi HTCC2506]|uniref:Prophage LambdaW5, baseplate assembly protein W, putative n=1 Tax=Fulvimarina pelagi HTCC2506 TaxID=314231 RepID=Q0FZ01_9HYPH|nr:GPW/gp25 family protein [Fulvimarina pelagi]EAU40157.1 prophage LambdaW5, baseplate assembly protein W, putative [Fulvimarina pelagi HTCC2506]